MPYIFPIWEKNVFLLLNKVKLTTKIVTRNKQSTLSSNVEGQVASKWKTSK